MTEIAIGIRADKNLFPPEQCRARIALCKALSSVKAPIMVGFGTTQMPKRCRNNSRVIFFDDEVLNFEIRQTALHRLQRIINKRVAFGLNERFRFYHYEKGRQFAYYMDGYFRR